MSGLVETVARAARLRTMRGAVITTLWTISVVAFGLEPGPWARVGERDGVLVERRVVEGNPLPEFRATTVVSVPLAAVLTEVLEVGHHCDWMYNTIESYTVRRKDEDDLVIYHRLSSPPPVHDRDVVLRVRTTRESGKAVVGFRATDDERVPRRAGVIRMSRLDGSFTLTALDRQRTRVEYRVLADPGGRLPVWMAERGTRDMPLFTLLRLRHRVEHARRP